MVFHTAFLVLQLKVYQKKNFCIGRTTYVFALQSLYTVLILLLGTP